MYELSILSYRSLSSSIINVVAAICKRAASSYCLFFLAERVAQSVA